jgi:hypothetical protein
MAQTSGADGVQRLGRHRAADDRPPWLDDTGLFRGDGGVRRAEPVAMVEADARNHAHERGGDDIRRVEPSAEPRLEDRHVRPAPREEDECDGGKRFKEGHLQPVLALKAREHGEHLFRHRPERVVRNRRAVKEESLVEGNEVRRRVARHAVTSGAKNRIKHGGSRALAVRAGNVDAAEHVLRIA